MLWLSTWILPYLVCKQAHPAINQISIKFCFLLQLSGQVIIQYMDIYYFANKKFMSSLFVHKNVCGLFAVIVHLHVVLMVGKYALYLSSSLHLYIRAIFWLVMDTFATCFVIYRLDQERYKYKGCVPNFVHLHVVLMVGKYALYLSTVDYYSLHLFISSQHCICL